MPLKMSAGFAAAGGFACVEMAKAGPVELPVIDKLSVRVRVLVDEAIDPQRTLAACRNTRSRG